MLLIAPAHTDQRLEVERAHRREASGEAAALAAAAASAKAMAQQHHDVDAASAAISELRLELDDAQRALAVAEREVARVRAAANLTHVPEVADKETSTSMMFPLDVELPRSEAEAATLAELWKEYAGRRRKAIQAERKAGRSSQSREKESAMRGSRGREKKKARLAAADAAAADLPPIEEADLAWPQLAEVCRGEAPSIVSSLAQEELQVYSSCH